MFEDAVQEIYDVSLLPGIRFPEILDAASEVATDTFLLPPPQA
ncbi:TIGR03032 family protein [Nocardioides litoris]|nr:TIGR03032 family protein [Nocardioides litoris]